jgi:hypothetical protein
VYMEPPKLFAYFSLKEKGMRMMSRNQMMIPLFVFLLLFSISSIAVGETVILQPGPEEGNDTWIWNIYPHPTGNQELMFAWSNVSPRMWAFSLVKFALPSWLSTKNIVSARLELYADLINTGSTSGVTVNVHRVLEPWEEISVWGDLPLGDYPDSQGLFHENVESSFFATAPGPIFFDVTNLVRDWISEPLSNYGVLLETPDSEVPSSGINSVGMYTSDAINPPDIDYHPKLIIDYTEPPPATIDFHPNTLNLKSKGKWVTCYIELEGHDVEDINIETIAITSIAVNGEDAEVIDDIPAEDHPTEVGDYDGDGIPDLMVKFDRQWVQESIADLMLKFDRQSIQDAASVVGLAKVKIKIYFETDSTGFEGFDEVVIIDKGK